ncbi:MAG TPA: winged helix DNA-binding protein [Clostridia bacterium]|nr:winged helix DNA-binding protein [Clostridia bacterium]HOR90607.1 winged helix DNA-binding protein [Clostridia bacterium]
MVSNEKIKRIIRLIEDVELEKVFKSLNDTMSGMGAALHILYEYGRSTTSGQLCDLLGVSSARVAVLLKTMESKGLIVKRKGVLDARTTVVSLTAFGEETTLKIREEMYNRIIDYVGFAQLEQFFAVAKQIEKAVTQTANIY